MKVEFLMRSQQRAIYDHARRFNVLLAHRRFGKTVFSVMMSIIKNLQCEHPRPQTHYFAPTYSQAKKIAWAYVKDYSLQMGAEFNESELKAVLPNKGILQLGSADKPHSNRGIYSDFAVLDEPAQMPSIMFTEVLRPALSDRQGGMLMIGTPQGRHGLFYDKYTEAAELDNWNRFKFKASETGILPEDELLAARRDMSTPEYEQEYECSWDAAIKGSYYASAMDDDRIIDMVYDRGSLVYCAFDLGMNDSTGVWFFQLEGEKVRLIDYQEYQNTGLPMIVRDLKKRPYDYGPMIFPQDVKVRSLSTGRSRKHTLEKLGIHVVVAPKCEDLMSDIDITRTFLDKCWFDKTKCRHGIEALRQYRSEWIEKRNILSLRPLHDWSSHGADAMRYLATTPLSKLNTTYWGSDLDYATTGRH